MIAFLSTATVRIPLYTPLPTVYVYALVHLDDLLSTLPSLSSDVSAVPVTGVYIDQLHVIPRRFPSNSRFTAQTLKLNASLLHNTMSYLLLRL